MAVCQRSLEVDWKKEWAVVKKQAFPGAELEDVRSRQHQPLFLESFSRPLWKEKDNTQVKVKLVLIIVCIDLYVRWQWVQSLAIRRGAFSRINGYKQVIWIQLWLFHSIYFL